jgi:hypothetical protein
MAQTFAQTRRRIQYNVTCITGALNVDSDKDNMNKMQVVHNINTCTQYLT